MTSLANWSKLDLIKEVQKLQRRLKYQEKLQATYGMVLTGLLLKEFEEQHPELPVSEEEEITYDLPISYIKRMDGASINIFDVGEGEDRRAHISLIPPLGDEEENGKEEAAES